MSRSLLVLLAISCAAEAWHVHHNHVSVEVTHNGERFCVAVDDVQQHAHNMSSQSSGLPLAVFPCGKVQERESLNDALSSFWRVDSAGLIVSHVSGKCLSVLRSNVSTNMTSDENSLGMQEFHSNATTVDCTSSSQRWKLHQNGSLEMGESGRCLSLGHPHFNGTGVMGFPLALVHCDLAAGIWEYKGKDTIIYPMIDGWESRESPYYRVHVEAQEQRYRSFLHFTQSEAGQPLEGLSNSYTTFSFDGMVKVFVQKLQGTYKDVVIRPVSLGIKPQQVNNSTISFEMHSSNVKISVEFDKDWQQNALFVFADPLEHSVPSLLDPDVMFFGPGEQNISNPVILSNETRRSVYIAGGAYLLAGHPSENMFDTTNNSNHSGSSIRGRGIISGKLSSDGAYMINMCGEGHSVEGVTIVDPPTQSMMQINAPWGSCSQYWDGTVGGGRVENVKLLGWNHADGIYAGKRSSVSNCFIKVNDDGVKPFERDSIFSNLVLWQQENGWAIMLSWLTDDDQSNITVRDSTVLHDNHGFDWAVAGCDPCVPNQATIGAVHGGSGIVRDVLVENITVETRVMRPLWFGIDRSLWGPSGQGIMRNFTLRNIRFLDGGDKPSEIMNTFMPNQLEQFLLENVELSKGVVATSAEEAQLQLIPSDLDVTFTADRPPAPSPVPSAGSRIWYRANDDLCLDVERQNVVAQSALSLEPCDGHASQRWLFDQTNFTLKSAADSSLCVTIAYDWSGAGLSLAACDGSDEQVWFYDALAGPLYHCPKWDCDDAQYCMDIPGGDTTPDSDGLWIWECNQYLTQKWRVEGVVQLEMIN